MRGAINNYADQDEQEAGRRGDIRKKASHLATLGLHVGLLL